MKQQQSKLLCHWSNSKNLVLTRIQSCWSGQSSEDHCDKIIDVMQENGLDLKLFFNISTDSPNTNKLVKVE